MERSRIFLAACSGLDIETGLVRLWASASIALGGLLLFAGALLVVLVIFFVSRQKVSDP